MKVSFTILTAALLLALATPALAERENHPGKGPPASRGAEKAADETDLITTVIDSAVDIMIGRNDRNIIQSYVDREYRRDCPPGLAKKNNGCLPPGQAKKYTRGAKLGDDVMFKPLPDDLLRRLGPVKPGTRYVQVDQDVLLITEAGKQILDAVTLLSAVGD